MQVTEVMKIDAQPTTLPDDKYEQGCLHVISRLEVMQSFNGYNYISRVDVALTDIICGKNGFSATLLDQFWNRMIANDEVVSDKFNSYCLPNTRSTKTGPIITSNRMLEYFYFRHSDGPVHGVRLMGANNTGTRALYVDFDDKLRDISVNDIYRDPQLKQSVSPEDLILSTNYISSSTTEIQGPINV